MIYPRRVRCAFYGAAMTISTDDLTVHPNDLILCVDGRSRPRWASRGEACWRYFDEEWGRPPGRPDQWLETVALTVFQLGVTWQAVLGKRESLRVAFEGFHVERVAAYGEEEVDRLLVDQGIFRNRRKIEATITNARAMVALREPFGEVLGRHAGHPFLDDDGTVPTFTPASTQLAGELKDLGFTHIGPTAAFSLMQATGVIPIRAHYNLSG